VTRQILFTTILGWRIEHTNLEEILLKSRKALIWGFDGMKDKDCTYGVCNFLPFGSIVRFKKKKKERKKKSDRVK